MATDLTDFLPDVQPHVPGCPENLILDAIRGACIRFCVDTWIVRETLTAMDVTTGQDTYVLTASSMKESVGIVHLSYDSRDMDIKTEEELDIIDQGWRTADPGSAFYAIMLNPDQFQLNRIPAADIVGGLIPRIATRPTDTATQVDTLLYNEWKEAIKQGAIEELKEIPNKGWSDVELSKAYGKKFNFQIQRGKARARMGHATKSTTAKMRSWV